MGKYDDIINLPHHVSDYRRPMPIENRAAQFAPFAALSGHDDAIAETARTTEPFKELSEQETNLLSRVMNFASENNSLVEIRYFVPDKTKKGGFYKRERGWIKKLDEYDHLIIMKDGIKIPINFISEIEIIENDLNIDCDNHDISLI